MQINRWKTFLHIAQEFRARLQHILYTDLVHIVQAALLREGMFRASRETPTGNAGRRLLFGSQAIHKLAARFGRKTGLCIPCADACGHRLLAKAPKGGKSAF